MVSNAGLISKACSVDSCQLKLSCRAIMYLYLHLNVYHINQHKDIKKTDEKLSEGWCKSRSVGFHFKFSLLRTPHWIRRKEKKNKRENYFAIAFEKFSDFVRYLRQGSWIFFYQPHFCIWHTPCSFIGFFSCAYYVIKLRVFFSISDLGLKVLHVRDCHKLKQLCWLQSDFQTWMCF